MVIKQAQKAGQQTRLFCPILFLSFTHKTEHVILASIIRNNGNFLEVVCSLSSQRLDCSVKAGVFHIAPRRPKNVMARALHPKISDSLRKLLALLLLLNYMYFYQSIWIWMRVANISEEQTRSMYMSPPPNPSNSYSQVHEECHTNVIINHITLQNLKIQKDRNRLLCEILPLTPFVRMNGWLSSEDFRFSFMFLFQFSVGRFILWLSWFYSRKFYYLFCGFRICQYLGSERWAAFSSWVNIYSLFIFKETETAVKGQ